MVYVCIGGWEKDESWVQGLLLHGLWIWSMMEYYIVLMIFFDFFFLGPLGCFPRAPPCCKDGVVYGAATEGD